MVEEPVCCSDTGMKGVQISAGGRCVAKAGEDLVGIEACSREQMQAPFDAEGTG